MEILIGGLGILILVEVICEFILSSRISREEEKESCEKKEEE